MKPSPGLTWSVCFFERANIINISHTAYVCSTQGNFPEPCWGLGGGEVCSWMNHTWTCSKHPCWGIMRPNEVKNMNTPRLQQHLFLTLAPSWFFYSLPTPLSPSYPSPAPSLLLWSLCEGVQHSGEAPICGVSTHVLLHIYPVRWMEAAVRLIRQAPLLIVLGNRGGPG